MKLGLPQAAASPENGRQRMSSPLMVLACWRLGSQRLLSMPLL
jgi:hypothetical protein